MGKKYKVHSSKIVTVLIANYFSAFAWGLFAPLFALIVIDRGGNAADVGLIWGGYTLLTGTAMIIFGRIEDSKHLIKKLLVAGTLLQTVASVSLLIFDTNNGLIIAQFIFGLGFGMGVPAFRALYGTLLIKGKVASEWAFMDGGNMLIMSAAALVGGYIYAYMSASVLFSIMSIIYGISALLFLAIVRSLHKSL